jgi:hypothetical protein
MRSLQKDPVGTFHKSYDVNSTTAIETADESSKFLPLSSLWDVASLTVRYPTLKEEVVENVIEGFNCILEIYHLYGLSRVKLRPKSKDLVYISKLREALHESATQMLDFLSDQGYLKWVSYFKYKICAFYAYYESEKTDLVKPLDGVSLLDKPYCLIGGPCLRWHKNLAHSKPTQFLSFILSILQSKKGMPRPCPEFIQQAVEKTEIHLTTQPGPLPETFCLGPKVGLLEDDYLNLENFKRELRRTAREIFKDVVFKVDDYYRPFYPSTHSNFEARILDGGCVESIYNKVLKPYHFERDTLLNGEKVPALLAQETVTVFGKAAVKEQQRILENGIREVAGEAIKMDDTQFVPVWRAFYDQLKTETINERPLVQAVGLSEALKARVISKGPPLMQTFLKPFQMFLWSVLKKHDVFSLIGTPVTKEYMDKIIGHPSEDEELINGDYKASTDNLHSWNSETLANEIIDVLNENAEKHDDGFVLDDSFREILHRSLSGHEFHLGYLPMPDQRVGNPGDELLGPIQYMPHIETQKEGQLMGSISSFPFLCMANAAMCRWALELSNQQHYRLVNQPIEYRTKKAPLGINGDDCALRGRRFAWKPEGWDSEIQSLKTNWLRITAFGGLESSVGKTLFSLPHRPVAVINSQTFDLIEGEWEERKYVNMGLLLGKRRSVVVGTDTDKVSFHQLGAIHRELLESGPYSIRKELNDRFIYYNAVTLRKFPAIPWTMPEYLGGPGLMRLGPRSLFDRNCATVLIMNLKKENLRDRLRVQPVNNIPMWKLHGAVLSKVEDTFGASSLPYQKVRELSEGDMFPFGENLEMEDSEDNFSHMYKYLTIETLFTKRLNQVLDPYVDKLQKRQERALNRNNTIWRNVTKDVANHLLFGVRIREDWEIDYVSIFKSVQSVRNDVKLDNYSYHSTL